MSSHLSRRVGGFGLERGAYTRCGVNLLFALWPWRSGVACVNISKLDVAHPHESRCALEMHAAIFAFLVVSRVIS